MSEKIGYAHYDARVPKCYKDNDAVDIAKRGS
jgi:hypothetical protein